MAFYDPASNEILRLSTKVAEQAAYIEHLEKQVEKREQPDCPMCDLRERLTALEERLQNTLEVNHLWDGS